MKRKRVRFHLILLILFLNKNKSPPHHLPSLWYYIPITHSTHTSIYTYSVYTPISITPTISRCYKCIFLKCQTHGHHVNSIDLLSTYLWSRSFILIIISLMYMSYITIITHHTSNTSLCITYTCHGFDSINHSIYSEKDIKWIKGRCS